jgi:hypothetical protein
MTAQEMMLMMSRSASTVSAVGPLLCSISRERWRIGRLVRGRARGPWGLRGGILKEESEG